MGETAGNKIKKYVDRLQKKYPNQMWPEKDILKYQEFVRHFVRKKNTQEYIKEMFSHYDQM